MKVAVSVLGMSALWVRRMLCARSVKVDERNWVTYTESSLVR